MLGTDFKRIVEQVSRDKGINRDVLIQALEEALKSAARKKYGNNIDVESQYNAELGEIEVFRFREVAAEVLEPEIEISFEDARLLDPECEIGDSLGKKMDTMAFGRIAAQSAKQVIIQKMKDAERDAVYASYIDRKGEVINGIVQRIDRGDIIVNLGHTEAVLPRREQVPKELYRRGDRIRAYILDILYESRGPQIILSRTHPDFLIHLFRMEVPEISEGLVSIIGAAREPGVRAKFAVASNDSDIDPVGACVGMKGSRVQNVVQELKGEKIDIIAWHMDAAKYVCNALSPAEISRVIIDEVNKMMEVIVPDEHLSIAIGKRGQNVRLASKLTGWRLDVKSEALYNETMRHGYETLIALPGVSVSLADTLYEKGFFSAEELKMATVEDLIAIRGISEEDACQLIENADNWKSFIDTDDDVQDDEKVSEEDDKAMRPGYETLIILPNVSRDLADALYEEGFCSAEELSLAIAEDLTAIKGISEEDACQLIENADNWESFVDTNDKTDESDDDFQDGVETSGRSEARNNETMRPGYETLVILPDVSRDLADALYEEGFCSAEELSLAIVEDLTAIKGISEEDADQLIQNANNWETFLAQTNEADTDIFDVEDALVHESDVSMAPDSLNYPETGQRARATQEIAPSDEHDDQKLEDADITMPEKDVEKPDIKEEVNVRNEPPLQADTENILNIDDSEA